MHDSDEIPGAQTYPVLFTAVITWVELKDQF